MFLAQSIVHTFFVRKGKFTKKKENGERKEGGKQHAMMRSSLCFFLPSFLSFLEVFVKEGAVYSLLSTYGDMYVVIAAMLSV